MRNAPLQASLVIPGLFGPPGIKQLPEAWRDLSLPALEGFLSRARRHAVPGKSLEQCLFALFHQEVASGHDMPVAAVTRQWEARDAGEYWWLRADPVHLRADRDRIVMLGNSALNISAEECQAVARELNAHFAGGTSKRPMRGAGICASTSRRSSRPCRCRRWWAGMSCTICLKGRWRGVGAVS